MAEQFKKGLKKIKIGKAREGFDMPFEEEGLPHFPPSFNVVDKQMPEIKNWEVGENYFLVIEVRQVSKTDREGNPTRSEFDIVRYKALTGKALEDMTDEEFEIEQGEALTNKD